MKWVSKIEQLHASLTSQKKAEHQMEWSKAHKHWKPVLWGDQSPSNGRIKVWDCCSGVELGSLLPVLTTLNSLRKALFYSRLAVH